MLLLGKKSVEHVVCPASQVFVMRTLLLTERQKHSLFTQNALDDHDATKHDDLCFLESQMRQPFP